MHYLCYFGLLRRQYHLLVLFLLPQIGHLTLSTFLLCYCFWIFSPTKFALHSWIILSIPVWCCCQNCTRETTHLQPCLHHTYPHYYLRLLEQPWPGGSSSPVHSTRPGPFPERAWACLPPVCLRFCGPSVGETI